MKTAIITCWLITSALAYGWTFAYYQRKYPTLAENDYNADLMASLIFAIFPLMQFVFVLSTGRYKFGLKFC